MFLLGSFKIFFAKGVGKKLPHLQDLHMAFPIDHQEIYVSGEIHEHLTAGTAWRSVSGIVRDHCNRFELTIAFRNRFENCSSLSADRQRIRADFHIATSVDLSSGSEEGGTNMKFRIRCEGAFLRFLSLFDEIFVFRSQSILIPK